PLVVAGSSLGALSFGRVGPARPFAEAEIARVEALAGGWAAEIARARAEEATAPSPLQQALGAIAAAAARLCDARGATPAVVGGGQLTEVASHGPRAGATQDRPPSPLDRASVLGRAVLERRTIRAPDLGAPLESGDGHEGVREAPSSSPTVLAAPLL